MLRVEFLWFVFCLCLAACGFLLRVPRAKEQPKRELDEQGLTWTGRHGHQSSSTLATAVRKIHSALRDFGKRVAPPHHRWNMAPAFGLAILIVVGVGAYYHYTVAPAGEVVVEDVSGKRNQFVVDSENKLEQILAQIKGQTSPVTAIHFEGTSVTDLEAIKNLTSLKTLGLSGTRFNDLSQIEYFPELEQLDVSNTKISDFRPLSDLTHLQVLNLEGTDIADLSPLSSLVELRELNVARTKVTNVQPLEQLTKLEELNLDSTGVQDLGPLYSLSALKTLDVCNTRVTSQEIESLRTRLAEQGNSSAKIAACPGQ
jgi:Leucine Rich repeats (2 copies)